MNGNDSPTSSFDSSSTPDQDIGIGSSGGRSGSWRLRQRTAMESPRRWHDVFWLGVFSIHTVGVSFALAVLGLNRFRKTDRFNIDKYTSGPIHGNGLTEDYWPIYALAASGGALIGWAWLMLLGSSATFMMKFSVHILTTYLAVISVLCFWSAQVVWGVAFAIGAALQFLYVISVIDRLPFTMLVLQKAVTMVWSLPEAMRVAYAFIFVMLLWMAQWSFGASGLAASSIGDGGRWWLLLVLSISLFWTGAVLCNTVHVIVSGMVFLVLSHGTQESSSMLANSLVKSLRYTLTTSFGSICYGSLFTAAIRTLRWEIRGLRSKIGKNECLLCCVDFLFNLVETLVRFFNKYAYVQIAIYGKGFNNSARDAWELFQSTGVEALVAYDCSGAVLLMGTLVGGLITGTASGVWAHIKQNDKTIIVGSTGMLIGMIVVGLAVVVVESAVTSIYICYAEDPMLIHRWDADFFNQLSETLHKRLQYRSARANRFDVHLQETLSV